MSERIAKRNASFVNNSIAVLVCPSPNGKLWSVLVDADLLPEILNAGFWRVTNFYPTKKGGFRLYAYTSQLKPVKRMVYLHRFVANPAPGFVVDHINHRSTDNRRSNLRSVTEHINQLNRQLASCGASGLRGVRQYRERDKWVAKVGDKQLGVFTDKEQAARVVQAYLRSLGVAA